MKKQKYYVVQVKYDNKYVHMWADLLVFDTKEQAFEGIAQLSAEDRDAKFRVIEREIVDMEVKGNE